MKICLVLSKHSILLGKEHENKSISALGLRTSEVSFAAFSQTYTYTDIQIKKSEDHCTYGVLCLILTTTQPLDV